MLYNFDYDQLVEYRISQKKYVSYTKDQAIDLCNVMNNYAEDLTSQVRKNDEKIAQQDFDMAKMVDFLT